MSKNIYDAFYIKLSKLNKIYYLKKQPNLIPYITSYYKKDWGFCCSFNEFKKLDKKKDIRFLSTLVFPMER